MKVKFIVNPGLTAFDYSKYPKSYFLKKTVSFHFARVGTLSKFLYELEQLPEHLIGRLFGG